MLLALVAGALLAVFPPGASSAFRAQPQRNHGHGHWFEQVCTNRTAGHASCSAQVVSNAAGTPLAGAAPAASAYGPNEFHTGYNLPTTAAAPTTIAIVDAYDNPNVASDLAAFSSYYGLPQLNAYTGAGTASPWFRKVNQSGGTTPPRQNSGWGLEIALDVETAHEICQNCNILLVEASSNSMGNLGTAENTAVALGADVVSNSWGGSESSGETTAYDPYFNHPGVVITASTGDSGYGVEYPAASPYVVGVGGTTLNLKADGSWLSESAWSGGGSGCSAYEPKPSWQTDTGCAHRTVADVSADADPNTGAAVYDTYGYGGWLQVGGTSLASPLIASVFALSGNTTNPSAPYADPGQLHDVTQGSNGNCGGSYLCTAGNGYDGPTGLGTPNGDGAFVGTPPAPDYSLAASPASQTVAPGQGTTYTVTLTPLNSYAGTVALTGTSGAPSGASAGLSDCQALTSGAPSCTVDVSTLTSTPNGSSTLEFTGSDGSIQHTADATLVVQAPDYSLAASPVSQTVPPGQGTTYTVTLTPLNGYAGAVALTGTSGLPSGATAGLSSCQSLTSGSPSCTVTVSTSSSTPSGSSTLTFAGSDGTLQHTASATLVVQAGNFSLSISPTSQRLRTPGSVQYTITITGTGGFNGTVGFSVSGLPAGLTASFASSSQTSATLTISASSRVRRYATYTFTVTGTAPGVPSHTATARISLR